MVHNYIAAGHLHVLVLDDDHGLERVHNEDGAEVLHSGHAAVVVPLGRARSRFLRLLPAGRD